MIIICNFISIQRYTKETKRSFMTPKLHYVAILTICFCADSYAEEKKGNPQDTIIVTADRNEKTVWDSSVSVNAVNRDEIE